MGLCNSTNNKNNNVKNPSELKNSKTQYGDFSKIIKSRTEEKDKTDALRNIKTEHFRVKDLKENLDKVDPHSFDTKPVYDVQANIDPSKDEVLLIFLIDDALLMKFRSKVVIIVKAILNDFKRYFENKQEFNDNSIVLNLLIYSSSSISSIMEYTFKDHLNLINSIEITSLVKTNDVIGEIIAINKISELEPNDQKSSFIFHFLHKTSNKEEIYDSELDDNLRNFIDVKYEILYFEGKNEAYERKLEALIPFHTLSLE